MPTTGFSTILNNHYTMNTNGRLEKYIDKIDTMPQGRRNGGLHNIGLLFRKNFGLAGDALESALSRVNRQKCLPPLSTDEITTIRKQVDKSDIPLGETIERFDAAHLKHFPKSKPKYYVSASADAIDVVDLLQKEVSIYPDCLTPTPTGTSTIGKILETFRTGGNSKSRINAIRNEPDKERRSELKKLLPAVVFGSEPQEKRQAGCCKANGIICLDFDNIPPEELESAKQTIAAVDYVFAAGLSVSGRGIFALAAYEGSPLKELIAEMQIDFGYSIDKQCSDVSRLRYVTLDENLIIKNKVYPAMLVEETENEETANDERILYVPFPVECLPPTLANLVEDKRRCINLKDPAMPAIAAIAVVSSVIGSSCQIEIKKGYTEPAGLFTAIVLDSGHAKSASIDVALNPLYALQSEKIKKWKREEYDWKKELADWKNTEKKNRCEEPEQPQPPQRHIIGDATIESVAGILENNPHGVLLYRDELNGFFAGMDAYRKSSTDLQSWIEIFEGRSLTVDRKATGTVYIDKPSVSIIGGIQKEILKQTIKERKDFFQSGFASRFIFAMPEKEPVVWNETTPDATILSNYATLIERILIDREATLEKDETGISALATIKPFVFTLPKNVRRLLIDFQAKHARNAIYEDAPNAAVMNKAGRVAARLCLTLHCVRSVEQTGSLGWLPEISQETAENAIALADWFVHEAERVHAMLAGEEVDGELNANQREIMKKIRRQDGEVSVKCLKDSIGKYHKKGGTENLEKELREMTKNGILTVRNETAKNGRSVEKFSIPTIPIPTIPKNSGKKWHSGNGNNGNEKKNAPSPSKVIEGFGEYQNEYQEEKSATFEQYEAVIGTHSPAF